MQYTVNEIYTLLLQNVNNIYDIFKNHFGESFVDLHIGGYLKEENLETVIKNRITDLLKQRNVIIPDNDYDTKFTISEEIFNHVINDFETDKATIYVWWPEVTVTNENDKSIDIQDLYAKIIIQFKGRIPYEEEGFLLNRATYSEEQFHSNYMHSHISKIPKGHFSKFQSPCLGRGPIGNTILTLKNEYDEAMWMLFCQELSMYVTVESLEGVPWKRLEEVSKDSPMWVYQDYQYSEADRGHFTAVFSEEKLKNFITYYLQHGHLSFSFYNAAYHSTLSFYEYIIDISNAFIDWYNLNIKNPQDFLDICYKEHLLYKTHIIDQKFYYPKSNNPSSPLDQYQNKFVLTFKGKEILTTITKSSKEKVHLSTILNKDVAMYILRKILRTINFRYTNEHNINNRREELSPATINQRVCYLQPYSSSMC